MSSSRLSCRLFPSVVFLYSWYAMLHCGGPATLLLSHGSGRLLRPRSHQKNERKRTWKTQRGPHCTARRRAPTDEGGSPAPRRQSRARLPVGPLRAPRAPRAAPASPAPSGRTRSGAARKRKAEGGARPPGAWGGERGRSTAYGLVAAQALREDIQTSFRSIYCV